MILKPFYLSLYFIVVFGLLLQVQSFLILFIINHHFVGWLFNCFHFYFFSFCFFFFYFVKLELSKLFIPLIRRLIQLFNLEALLLFEEV